jgi:drug/metabolite transporter (DMT)-like permease
LPAGRHGPDAVRTGLALPASGEASLIATLETPLMVFWIWVAFAEVHTTRTLIGGALVIGAVVADILADNRARMRVTSPSSPSSTAG